MTIQTAHARRKRTNKAWLLYVLCLIVFLAKIGLRIVPALMMEIATDLDVSVAVAG